VREAPLAPSQHAGVTAECDALVAKMLAKDPADRHRDAFHLMEDLRAQLARLHTSHGEATSASSVSSGSVRPSPDPSGRPTLHMPVERDDWTDRVALYRRELDKLHPDGTLPGHVRDSMRALEDIVAEAARLRIALHGSAQELAESQHELRATRLRIGRALDELASDESKLSRAQEAQQLALTQALALDERTLTALLARPAIGEVALRRGEPLSEAHAVLLQGLALIMDDMRAAHRRSQELQHEHATNAASLVDIRFQVEQLKSRLASLNAASSSAQDAVQERVQTVEIRLRGQMDRLVAEAELVALYLRTHARNEPVVRTPQGHND
jgi:serine/threonine-protein kinase